jgi:hypothetical protein
MQKYALAMMHRSRTIMFTLLIGAVVTAPIIFFKVQDTYLKNTTIVTAFNNINALPDPAQIFTTSEWYFLNHVSSALAAYNHEEGRFNPLLADSWSIKENGISFHIAESAKFSDGTPITSNDVEYSLKRLILKKTSTHFPVWEQLLGCEKLKSIKEACAGIKILDDRTIEFTLVQNVESFFLLMASPEGGIWHWRDIDPLSLELAPTRYSGPYAYKKNQESLSELDKNLFSIIHKNFPNSPDRIPFYSESGDELQEVIRAKKIDIYMEPVRPFFAKIYEEWGYERQLSVFSTILYLSKVGQHSKQIGQPFFKALWTIFSSDDIVAADSVLPFGSLSALDKSEFLAALPEKSTSEPISVAIMTPYFRPELKLLLEEAARLSHTPLKVTMVDRIRWAGLHGKTENDEEFDFVFTIYVASERYPSVQIRFLLDGRLPPFSIDDLDSPNYSPERKTSLAKLEEWMISSQTILPLFFTRTHIIHKSNIDIGNQPISDAEIQLWRVKKL